MNGRNKKLVEKVLVAIGDKTFQRKGAGDMKYLGRICRLMLLMRMLQSGRCYSANELADELEVSRRTIFRDLAVLEATHIPYYFDEQRRGYRISKDFRFPMVEQPKSS